MRSTQLPNQQLEELNTDPTGKFQKLYKTMNNCNQLTDKSKIRFLLQIQPTAPKLKARTKIHNQQTLTGPAVSNIHVPTDKVIKHLNKRLLELIQLPNTYDILNSPQLALN
jgi:hypothetical protein